MISSHIIPAFRYDTGFACAVSLAPVKLPISPLYDLALLADLWFDSSRRRNLARNPLGWLDGQCVQGAGTYSPLDANQRLLGISASRGRVAALDPDREWV